MNHTKLKTESGHALFVRSMNKLHRVTHLSFNKEGRDKLFNAHSSIAVASMPSHPGVALIAQQFGGEHKRLTDISTHERTFTNLYMWACGHYFQIGSVYNDPNIANEYLRVRTDTAPLDSTTFPKDQKQFHVIASEEKAGIVSN